MRQQLDDGATDRALRYRPPATSPPGFTPRRRTIEISAQTFAARPPSFADGPTTFQPLTVVDDRSPHGDDRPLVDPVSDPGDENTRARGAGATPERFAEFYRAHWGEVARGLTATLGDRELAVEATNEAMTRAYAHWPKIGAYEFPTGWVYRVGLNWARSHFRRVARVLPFRRDGHATATPPAGVDAIADPAIRDALLDLDVKYRSVVVCRLLLDWSVDDTASALDIAPGTVKSRLARGLTILESTLAHLGPDA